MIYKDHSKRFYRNMFRQVLQGVTETAWLIERDAKRIIAGEHGKHLKAVDTSRYINSISVSNSETGPSRGTTKPPAKSTDGVKQPPSQRRAITAVIGSNVEYASFIELGTGGRAGKTMRGLAAMAGVSGSRAKRTGKGMPARPAQRIALEMHKDTLLKRIKAA